MSASFGSTAGPRPRLDYGPVVMMHCGNTNMSRFIVTGEVCPRERVRLRTGVCRAQAFCNAEGTLHGEGGGTSGGKKVRMAKLVPGMSNLFEDVFPGLRPSVRSPILGRGHSGSHLGLWPGLFYLGPSPLFHPTYSIFSFASCPIGCYDFTMTR